MIYVHQYNLRQVAGRIKAVFHKRPGEALVQTAKEEKASFFVMGSRGLGTVRRTVLGSVSDYVTHHIHCPVAIWRHLEAKLKAHTEEAHKNWEKVLVYF